MTTAETPARTPTEYPHIERDHKGRPVIKGTSFRVSMVVNYIYGVNQFSPERLVEGFQETLDLTKIHQALAYYHENRKEIDGDIARELAFVDEQMNRPEYVAQNEQFVAKTKQYLKDHPDALVENETAMRMRREMV